MKRKIAIVLLTLMMLISMFSSFGEDMIDDALSEDAVPSQILSGTGYTEMEMYATSGYLLPDGSIVSTKEYVTSQFISLAGHEWIKANVDYGWKAQAYVIYNEAKEALTSKDAKTGTHEQITMRVADILEKYPAAAYIRFTGKPPDDRLGLCVFTEKKQDQLSLWTEQIMRTGNVLYGKKIAFCGDSFTEASNLGDAGFNRFYYCYHSFGCRIAERNCMELYHDGIGGSTMHIADKKSPATGSPFAYQRYQNVPDDCDYIILQFGLNESSIADSSATRGIKDSTDTTTMWGSWNTVLAYLIEHHPFARIGIIMPDAWMPQSYYETLKEISEWWGIPMLDLGGDPDVPVMNGGRRRGSGLTLNPAVEAMRNQVFYTDYKQNDSHPNDAGHEWRSTVIENWIRGL